MGSRGLSPNGQAGSWCNHPAAPTQLSGIRFANTANKGSHIDRFAKKLAPWETTTPISVFAILAKTGWLIATASILRILRIKRCALAVSGSGMLAPAVLAKGAAVFAEGAKSNLKDILRILRIKRWRLAPWSRWAGGCLAKTTTTVFAKCAELPALLPFCGLYEYEEALRVSGPTASRRKSSLVFPFGVDVGEQPTCNNRQVRRFGLAAFSPAGRGSVCVSVRAVSAALGLVLSWLR
jgi:hypothetical protein